MLSDLGTFGDHRLTLEWIGRIALKTKTQYNIGLADLSDWLTIEENREANDPSNLTESPFKETTKMIFATHEYIGFDSIFPYSFEMVTPEHPKHIEIGDLLLATVILTPLVENILTKTPLLGTNGAPIELNGSLVTQIVLFLDERCLLTLDSESRSVIGSMKYIADSLGIYCDRAKRRRAGPDGTTPFYRETRVLYDHFRHRPKEDLMRTLRTTHTPLTDLSGTLASLRCSFKTMGITRFSNLDAAIAELISGFEADSFGQPIVLEDNSDAIR